MAFQGQVRQLSGKPVIHYTKTDEAPMLATYALYPIMRKFCEAAGAELTLTDISVASRILCQFGLDKDNLAELGEVAKTPDGHIIKLPNVSASIPQLVEAIKELQAQGFAVPDFPANPQTDAEKEIRAKYAKVLGSAVNPVLREGNSDRRAAKPVKEYAKKNRLPVKAQPWKDNSKAHVAAMKEGDFYGSEKSYTCPEATSVKIELQTADGNTKVLKAEVKLTAGEVIDASFMSVSHLRQFFEEQFQDGKATDTLVSLHLKATMMKISDPIMFGHAVSVFYRSAMEKHADALAKVGANPNEGLGSVLAKVKAGLPAAEADVILADFNKVYEERPRVAMVDSAKGITNFHVPSDVIIDASMPPMVRDGGQMWNKDDKLEDAKAIIPDRCYAGVFQTIIADCQKNGQFDHTTLGHVSNVGLMARAAEEYGSHDKTFEVPEAGTVRVTDASGKVIFEHSVGKGDIWRMCQTKDEPIRDWVKLAYRRASVSKTPAYFWLDSNRAHDREIMKKVEAYKGEHEASVKEAGVEVAVMSPVEACQKSLDRARAGQDTISVTGNVLRDYNTDMFPIIELGTSAKMLSIVPLLNNGFMFETGAGGSAPKHVQQFVKEGHLRWDSLGEYLAVGSCLEDVGRKYNLTKLTECGEGLNNAVARMLDANQSPGRKVKEIDNRLTHYWIARYWAEAMAPKESAFGDLAKKLTENEAEISKDLIECQGPSVDLGGYWRLDDGKATAAMCPSKTLNEILGMTAKL